MNERRLAITRQAMFVGALACFGGALLTAQEPSFDVAVIKRSVSAPENGTGFRTLPGGRIQVVGVSVRGILGFAYPATEQIGLPTWAQSERFDIDAKGQADASRDDMVRMLRKLLNERFVLQAHFEKRTKTALALVVSGRGRPDAMVRIDDDCDEYAPTDGAGQRPSAPTPLTEAMPACTWVDGGALLRSGGMSMGMLANRLTAALGEPVYDKTALPGFYRFLLKYRRAQDSSFPFTDDYQEIPTALKDQLGLELKSSRLDLDVLVIDHVERPAEN